MAVTDPSYPPRADNPNIDDARALMRGASRLLLDLGVAAIPEFTLPCGRGRTWRVWAARARW
jgi:hypothetical protein